MPTYEFECPSGHRFEKMYRRFADAPSELTCSACGAAATRRISGGAGLHFKGSGFYITDYGKGGKKPESAASEAGGSATGGDSTTSKGESKGPSGSESKSEKPASSEKKSNKPSASE